MRPNSARILARLGACLLALGPVSFAVGQQPSPTVAAFRESARDLGERLRLSVDAMPAELYGFHPAPTLPSFSQLVQELAFDTESLCTRVAGARAFLDPAPAVVTKDSLSARVTAAFEGCDRVLAALTDVRLSDSIPGTMLRKCCVPVTRARAMTWTTTYWADVYAQLAMYLRLNGRVPPEVCRKEGLQWNLNYGCDSGFGMCKPVGASQRGLRIFLADSGYSVRSDGGGPYATGGAGTSLVASNNGFNTGRSIVIDLDHPVAGDIGVPHGVVTERRNWEFEAQWYTDPDFVQHSTTGIPIGATVAAEQIEVNFLLNGEPYMLQFGPQPGGHCFSDGTAIYGAQTSRGTIRRESEVRWVVDLPPGSIGRLFNRHLGDPNAVNKGLYYASLHFVVEK